MNLRELSELLGLSQTTVSRALNGYPEVSEGTRARVMDAARLHNYSPNARAQSLATGKSMAIGHVIPGDLRAELTNVVFGEFVAGAGEIYAARGYDMLVSVVGDDGEMKAYRELALRRKVDGVVVHGPTSNDPRIPLLRSLGLPFVVHGRSSLSEGTYNWVDVDNRRAIARATGYLAGLNHRVIGLINGRAHYEFARRRRAGFHEALAQAGLSADDGLVASGDMTEPFGYSAARQMLNRQERPTALLCASIVQALGARRAAEELGLRIGRDISIVCFDDVIESLPNGSPDTPIYTAMRSPVRAAGRRCAEVLLETIDDPDRSVTEELWEAELVIGSSTGPAPFAAVNESVS